MPRESVFVTILGLPKFLLDYEPLDAVQRQIDGAICNVLQVTLSSDTSEETWMPWVYRGTPASDADMKARDLALFLSYYEYCRVYNHEKAGKELTVAEKARTSVDISNASLPQHVTRARVHRSLSSALQNRVEWDIPMSEIPLWGDFNPKSVPVNRLLCGRKAWKAFWDTYLKRAVDSFIRISREKAEDKVSL